MAWTSTCGQFSRRGRRRAPIARSPLRDRTHHIHSYARSDITSAAQRRAKRRRKASEFSAGLCRRFERIPAGEYQHCRVTPESARQYLCALYAEIDPAIFDGGNGGLRNTGEFRKLALTQLLELANNPDRFANRNFDPFLCWAKLFHIMAFDNRGE